MSNLQDKVQKMLEGETKRREIASQWLSEVKEALLPVAEDIWGSGIRDFDGSPYYAIGIPTPKVHKGGDDPTSSGLYFRYKEHEGSTKIETPDFYYDKGSDEMPLWGVWIEDFRGANYWGMIRTILEWIPTVLELMEKKAISRENLIAKLVVK
jgi:hypothetical protein